MEKVLKILIICLILIVYCNGKAYLVDPRFVTRSATEYKTVVSFPVASCSSFVFDLVADATTCPVTTDNKAIDYLCEGNKVYVISSSGIVTFAAKISGVPTTSICTVGEYAGSCDFFHEPIRGDEINCTSEYCSSTSFASGCSNGKGLKDSRNNFILFNTGSSLTDLGCKAANGDCCSEVNSACSAPSTCPFNLFDSFSPSGFGAITSAKYILANEINVLKPGQITEIKVNAAYRDSPASGNIYITTGALYGLAGATVVATIPFSSSSFSVATAIPLPELLFYTFEGSGTSVPNLAASPPAGTATATIQGGITQGGTAICNGTLIGTGLSANYLNTSWVPNLGGGSWTISFKTENIAPSSTLYYIFGELNTASFRCFTNGVAGANNWILRGAGINDTLLPGGATVAPHTNTFVYNATSNTIKAYLDGVLVSTVNQNALSLTGSGSLQVMGYGGSVGSPANGHLDEFRLYNRALSVMEVKSLVSCGQSCTGTPTTFTPSPINLASPGNYFVNFHCTDCDTKTLEVCSSSGATPSLPSPAFTLVKSSYTTDFTATSPSYTTKTDKYLILPTIAPTSCT